MIRLAVVFLILLLPLTGLNDHTLFHTSRIFSVLYWMNAEYPYSIVFDFIFLMNITS